MSFYVFVNGDVADGEGEVNANFNELIYAILYNRMENDSAGTTQIDPAMQSDIYSDADGNYNTVCTTDTTSTFTTNLYSNRVTDVTNPYSIIENCYYLCCTGGAGCFTVGCADTNAFACLYACVSRGQFGDICTCLNNSTCAGTVCPINYCCIMLCNCLIVATDGEGSSTHCACITRSVNGNNTVISRECSTGGLCCAYSCYVLTRLNDACYCLTCNGTGICCVCPTTYNFCITTDMRVRACANCASSGCYSWAYACAVTTLSRTRQESTKISTNIKNYGVIKNTFVFNAITSLPAGNCLRAKVYNQAGCLYLDNAVAECVYTLCAADSCCFYVELWQCVCGYTCAFQCMTQYATRFM